MAALDAVSIMILLGALLVLTGILSSLVAMRFGAPLLFVFLLVGMLAGESGPGGIRFDDVRSTYIVGSVALALILFDGGLRTRFATFRNVLGPAVALATIGVVLTALLTAPVARFTLGLSWVEAMLVGAVVASTDAAAVFFLLHARGLRLRPRVAATLEVESGSNDPFAVFLTIVLVQFLLIGEQTWQQVTIELALQAIIGTLIGILGGRAIVLVLNQLGLPQGLHAPFVTTSALVIFGFTSALHGSGFLAVYLAGLVVGNRATRAHNTVIVFLDALTWLAQIAMFVLLGLLVSPARLLDTLVPALAVAATLMVFARPVAVFLCLTPFRFPWREKAFIAWVGLRGAVGIFLASIPLLVMLPNAEVYFNIAFVVVLASLLIQGWSIAPAARLLHVGLPRHDHMPRRVELDLPGQLEQEIVGYPVAANSRAGAPGRLRLSPGAAREGAGARSFLRRHAATGASRSASPGGLLRDRRAYARRACRNLWADGCGGGEGHYACRPFRNPRPAHGTPGRHAAAWRDCAGGAPGDRWPRGQRRPAARGR
jgi:cell volume regulation protein A